MKDFDDNMDDFDFKPITKGLGFHHSLQEKAKIKSDLKLQAESLKSDLDERAKKLLSDGSANSLNMAQTKPSTHMGELSPFYDNAPKVEDIPKLRDVAGRQTEYRFFDAPMSLRLKAWSVDILAILTMFTTTIASLFVLADMPFDTLARVMISSDIAPSLLAIFSLFYVLYFSILDKTTHSTIGKSLFGMRLIGTRDEMNLSLSALKSILSLVSILSMGMLTVLSIPDQLSHTRVVQK